MFIEERHNSIIKKLNKDRRVSVAELSERFDLSVDSIRRDLRILEKKGLLIRTHGGAIVPEDVERCPDVNARKNILESEKDEIGKLAASYIKDGDVILIEGASTTSAMIPYLFQYKDLEIFTNSIDIAYELSQHDHNFKIFVIGGYLVKGSSNVYSNDTLMFLKDIYVNKAFISPSGISHKAGVNTGLRIEAQINRAMLNSAKEAFILADHTKFLYECHFHITPLSRQYRIISDSLLSYETIDKINSYCEEPLRIITPRINTEKE